MQPILLDTCAVIWLSEEEHLARALGKQQKLFVSQNAFFCYVINTLKYNVTPSPDDPNRQRMIDALLESNALWYPLRYPAEYSDGGTINQVIHYHYPSADDMKQIMRLNNFRDFGGGNIYNAAFGFLDQNPHNTMHIWTGGQNPRRLTLAVARACASGRRWSARVRLPNGMLTAAHVGGAGQCVEPVRRGNLELTSWDS